MRIRSWDGQHLSLHRKFSALYHSTVSSPPKRVFNPPKGCHSFAWLPTYVCAFTSHKYICICISNMVINVIILFQGVILKPFKWYHYHIFQYRYNYQYWYFWEAFKIVQHIMKLIFTGYVNTLLQNMLFAIWVLLVAAQASLDLLLQRGYFVTTKKCWLRFFWQRVRKVIKPSWLVFYNQILLSFLLSPILSMPRWKSTFSNFSL